MDETAGRGVGGAKLHRWLVALAGSAGVVGVGTALSRVRDIWRFGPSNVFLADVVFHAVGGLALLGAARLLARRERAGVFLLGGMLLAKLAYDFILGGGLNLDVVIAGAAFVGLVIAMRRRGESWGEG